MLSVLLFTAPVAANFFNFFGGHQQQHQQQPLGSVNSAHEHENVVLNLKCNGYVCPDTGMCVNGPSECPCPYPGSQLRCPLENGDYLCVLKPPIENVYDDDATNWQVDAGDNEIRDCGWVKRAFKGLL